jgi:sialidase-1
MRVLSEFTVYRDRNFYGISPGMTRTARGDLLVAFRRQPNRKLEDRDNLHIDTHSHVALIRSSDQGRTWSEPTVVHHDPSGNIGEQAGSMFTLASGRIILSSFRWEHIEGKSEEDLGGPHVFTRGYHVWNRNNPWSGAFRMRGGLISHSDDHGQTFSPWRDLSVPADRYIDGLCAVEGVGVELASGRLLLPVYAGRVSRRLGRVVTSYASLVLASDDQGVTWQFHSSAAENPDPRGMGFDEHSLCTTTGGEIFSTLRATFDPERAIWTARSVDQGLTWSLDRLNQTHGQPIKPLRLQDGRILMIYGYRKAPNAGIRAKLLNPDLSDLHHATEFVVRGGAEKVVGSRSPDQGINMDFGYPSAVEIAPGRVLVVYYWPDPDADAHIEATLIDIE